MNSLEEPIADTRDHRQRWKHRRLKLEMNRVKHSRFGTKRKSRWSLFEQLIRLFGVLLKAVNLYNRGLRNAKNISIHEVEAGFPDLPESFHGYRILHLTDLHLDTIEGIENAICDRIRAVPCDLCVLTGDYREKTKGDFRQILRPLEQIVQAVKAKDGVLSILGNHDTAQMAEHFDRMGVKFLANETIVIQRRSDKIEITGIDDPHYYYTDEAAAALNRTHDAFKISLVHTPELYDIAADRGYHLYLCGHTHGGQICLPGGVPVITHLYTGRKYAHGLWRHRGLTGYTSSGCGVVGIPIRLNCRGEVALIRLKREVAF